MEHGRYDVVKFCAALIVRSSTRSCHSPGRRLRYLVGLGSALLSKKKRPILGNWGMGPVTRADQDNLDYSGSPTMQRPIEQRLGWVRLDVFGGRDASFYLSVLITERMWPQRFE